VRYIYMVYIYLSSRNPVFGFFVRLRVCVCVCVYVCMYTYVFNYLTMYVFVEVRDDAYLTTK